MTHPIGADKAIEIGDGLIVDVGEVEGGVVVRKDRKDGVNPFAAI
jgi:hypothetical protein